MNNMELKVLIAFVLSLAPATWAHPVHDGETSFLQERDASYTMYSGDGTSWPAISQWTSFENMWSSNLPIMKTSCSQFNEANNSEQEINDILSAIKAQAQSTGVDSRFILATIMQESKGCVRVPSTTGQIVNPGLMQCHEGQASCQHGVNPCPTATINQMIQEGTAGTATGEGIKGAVARSGATGAAAVYRGARLYNSGSTGPDLGAPEWGTSCYSSDIANRLMGWAGSQTGCELPDPHH